MPEFHELGIKITEGKVRGSTICPQCISTRQKQKKAPCLSTTLLCFLLTNIVFSQDATLIYNNTVPSTVTIETDIGLGSGFFIGENLIATNYHVIEGAAEIHCYTNDSPKRYTIEGYIAIDKKVDLILLKVSGLNRKPLTISGDDILPGQKIYAIGSPKGLPATISDGIISGIREFDGIDLIQVSAPISEGSSGGPILDINGKVIGVSVGQYKSGQNLNFAIPVSRLRSLINTMSNSTINIEKIGFGQFIDPRDGIIYKTVQIGTQTWMAENLKATKYNDGTSIPHVTNATIWGNLSTPAFCWYNNDAITYKTTYGALYNWYTVNTGKLCPIGWHVPSYTEWKTLIYFLGGDSVAGGKLKEIGTNRWKKPNIRATNESGFTALPIECRNVNGVFLHNDGRNGYWWSATETHLSEAVWFLLSSGDTKVYHSSDPKILGCSVRCLKDE